jgi:iron-only hydrogenase group A
MNAILNMETITIRINGKDISACAGKTVLEVAEENGISIPTVCFHPHTDTTNHCNVCLVEVVGDRVFRRACSTPVREGMEIITESEELTEARRRSLDALMDKHMLKCSDCVRFQRCKLLEASRVLGSKPSLRRREGDAIFRSGTIEWDQSKCIGCGNCVSVCPVGFLSVNDCGRVSPSSKENEACIHCGQCVMHCPVGAISGVGEFEDIKVLEQNIADEHTTVVVQFAPSIRASIGDEFGMRPGEVVTGKLIAGLKMLGFDAVFDTASGADFTTVEESQELLDRIANNERLPAFTSCCPAWVSFVESYYPEFVPNLCTSRSPQIMLGGIVKHYWGAKQGMDPKQIVMVSIMPCVAKKYEIQREELWHDGVPPVDMVLTTRELARWFKKKKIVLESIEEEANLDDFCNPSGAGVIYGSSGGVFESALRTAYFRKTGEELPDGAVREIRGSNGVKTKEIRIGDSCVKVAVVSGIRNAKKILENLKEDPRMYDAVEVMACPGGCVGGGGQPLPITKERVRARAEALYETDKNAPIRRAHENPLVKKVYEEFLHDENVRKNLLHTHFSKKEKNPIEKI